MSLFDLTLVASRIEELEKKTIQEGFWSDSKTSSVVLQEMKVLKNKYTKYMRLSEEIENLQELNELLLLEEDDELGKELFYKGFMEGIRFFLKCLSL